MALNPPPQNTYEENRSLYFCTFLNPDKNDRMFLLARSVTLLLGVGVGWLLFLATRSFGPLAAFFALFLWAFDPTFLAWSTLVKADVPAAFFTLASTLLFLKSRHSPHPGGYSFLTGILMGMTVMTKLSCIFLIPAFMVIEFFPKIPFSNLWRRWVFLLAGLLSLIYLLYAPGFFHYGPTWTPFHELIRLFPTPYYVDKEYFPIFFLGHIRKPLGVIYYATVFFLKSTLPFLILFLLGAFLLIARKIRIEPWAWILPLFLILPLLIFSAGSLRYLLPAQVFLIMVSAFSAKWLWDLPKFYGMYVFRYFVLCLLLAHGLSVGLSYPRHISYFNDAVPRNRRMHLLGDSEFDVGQDWKRFAKIAGENGWKHIKIASDSTTNPSLYGVTWSRWTEKDLPGPQSGWVYVTSTAFLQSAPIAYPQTYPIAMSWVRKLPPTLMVGDTLILHVIPGNLLGNDDSPVLNSFPFLLITPPRPSSKPHEKSSP
jgi:4-amino-4-deoxy-L-arabinose transferase-like glycosyltransferase